jgi:hypothetical protein
MIDPDAGTTAPPMRGKVVDASVGVADSGTPPPVDAPVVVDVPAARDVLPDRITVVDTGPPDIVVTTPCTVANNNCPDGSYCLSANCITGVCTAAPASTEETPVCGCDRLTYWNTSIAAVNGTAVRVAGACPAGIACSDNNPNCPMPATCNLEQATAAGCDLNNPPGRCEVLPDNCPPLAAGITPPIRRCNSNNACQTRCNLIMAGRTFFVDPTCP